MAQVTIIISIILLIVSVVLILIAGSVALGLAGQLPSPTNQQLVAVGIMTYFMGVLIIITLILGFSWLSAKTKGTNAKGKGIAFLVMLIITILVYIVIIVITVIVRGNSAFDSTQQGALTANLVLIGVSFITFGVTAILIRATFKPKL